MAFLGDTGICRCFIHNGMACALWCQLTSCTELFFSRGRQGHLPWLSSDPLGPKWVLLVGMYNAVSARNFCREVHAFALSHQAVLMYVFIKEPFNACLFMQPGSGHAPAASVYSDISVKFFLRCHMY